MSSNKELNVNDLPSPDELLSVDQLPSPETLQPKEQATPGILQALARGGAQGATFAQADEATALAEHLATGKPYEQALAESRAAYKAAEEAHPIASMVGNIGGGIAGAFGLGEIAAPIAGLAGLGKVAGAAEAAPQALSTLQKIGKMAKVGAGYGALTSLGTSEKSALEQPMELAKDVATGGATGAAGGAVLSGAGQLAQKGLQQAGKIGAVQNILKSFEVGKKGISYFMPKDVEVLENKAAAAAADVKTAMQEKLNNMSVAKKAMLEEAAANGKTADILPDINTAKQAVEKLTTDEITGADKRKLQSILDAIPAETDYRELTPDKIDNIKRMFQQYTKVGDQALQTPEARQIAQNMVQSLNEHVLNSVDDTVVQSTLSKLAQDPKTANIAADASSYLGNAKDNVSAIKKLNSGLSDLMTAQDILGQTSTGNKAEQVAEIEKLRKILGRTATETEGGTSARQAISKAKEVVKNIAPDLAEKSFQPAEELGKQVQVGKYARGQLGGGPLNLFGVGNLATVGGANIAGNAYSTAEALSTPVTSSFRALSDYAKKTSAGKESFMTKALDKIANIADENRRKAMVNTLMQNPYYRNELDKLKKGMLGEEEGAAGGEQTK